MREIDFSFPGQQTLAALQNDPSAVNRRSHLRVRCYPLADLTTSQLAAWKTLDQQALSPNPFLSPAFVLPAWKHIAPQEQPFLIVISSGRDWIGLGVFEVAGPMTRFPVSHLRAWRTPHTFLQGMLLRAGDEDRALTAFWNYLQRADHPWHAVEWDLLANDGADTRSLLHTADNCGVEVHCREVHRRACLQLNGATTEQRLSGISTRRHRSLKQAWNWLNRQGEVEFRFQRDRRQLPTSCERFLELESLGWKAEGRSALKCTGENRAFFREMSQQFATENRLTISELKIDETVIGSVVHLTSGGQAFAFKLGWDPQFARGCPGFQLKSQAIYHAPQQIPQWDLIDSCAGPGSFIEHIWSGRRIISQGLFMTSRVGIVAGTFINTLRRIRNSGRRWLASIPEDPEHEWD